MSVRGNAAPRGMTAHDRIRLTGSLVRQRQPRLGTSPDAGPGRFLTGKSKLPCERAERAAASVHYHRDMLRVKLLEAGARAPVVAHPGEDLGYDVFALEAALLRPRATCEGENRDRRGSARSANRGGAGIAGAGLGRQSAARGMAATGGVIDSGYRGRRFWIVMTNLGDMRRGAEGRREDCANGSGACLTGLVQERVKHWKRRCGRR